MNCDDDVVPASLEGATDDLFAEEGSVDLGCVDVCDAEVERAVDRANGLGIIQATLGSLRACHGHGIEIDAGYLKVSELCILHERFSCSVRAQGAHEMLVSSEFMIGKCSESSLDKVGPVAPEVVDECVSEPLRAETLSREGKLLRTIVRVGDRLRSEGVVRDGRLTDVREISPLV